MATTRPFAYNTGSTLPYTDQVGDIAIGVGDVRYDEDCRCGNGEHSGTPKVLYGKLCHSIGGSA